MQELEISWRRTASVWWLIFWRAAVGTTAIAYVAGFILGLVLGRMGASHDTAGLAGGIVGAISGLVWGIFVVRMALRKNYRDFRLMLVAHGSS